MQPIERDILVAIRRIIRAVDLYSRQLMDQHGLTGPQLAALQALAIAGPSAAGELARSLQIGQATMTGILDRLERQELILRTRNGQDRRSVDVAITHKGRVAMEDAPPLLQDRFCRELGKLKEWEQTALLANLQRVAAMMEVEELEASPHLVTGADRL